MSNMWDELKKIVSVARESGALIMRYYRGELESDVSNKADNTPVTAADQAADRLIRQRLKEFTPGVPCLSEESQIPSFQSRSEWHDYWLVDPLDGTRGFIDRDGNFTVNIARIQSGVPCLGVVFMPDKDICYAAARGLGAFRSEPGSSELEPISTRPHSNPLVISRSARRSSEEYNSLKDYLSDTGFEISEKRVGGSIKLCQVAEGVSDFYPCFVPTSEWDTAAGQIIVEQAGGLVVEAETGLPLRYNKKETLLNPHFLAVDDPEFDWRAMLVTSLNSE